MTTVTVSGGDVSATGHCGSFKLELWKFTFLEKKKQNKKKDETNFMEEIIIVFIFELNPTETRVSYVISDQSM